MGARKQGIPKTLPLVTETNSPALNSCYWLSHCYYVVLVRMFKQTEERFDKPTESLCLHFLENHKANKCLTKLFQNTIRRRTVHLTARICQLPKSISCELFSLRGNEHVYHL